ncbi:MAG: hypothetical protein U0804_16005 [Gemmataceae bacterium]
MDSEKLLARVMIGQAARDTGLLENQLRKLCRRGLVPHEWCGRVRTFDSKDYPAVIAAARTAGYLPSPEAPPSGSPA